MFELYSIGELGAAMLQGLVTAGLALLLLHLHRRYQKPHFVWWSVALGARVLSVGAIVTFMVTGVYWLLFVHQVFIAWTALGFLYAAQVFSRHVPWRHWYLLVLALPVVWSYVAIFVLDHFALAAGPAVAFLALATLWAGVVFQRYRARTRSSAAGFLSLVLMLWAVHHLDYPILRARGAWNPWGYYVDILFVLAMGAGIVLLVLEEQREGLVTLTALSGDLRAEEREDSRDALLERPLALRGVRGSALLRATAGSGVELVRGVGDCASWTPETIPPAVRTLALDVLTTGRTRLEGEPRVRPESPPFTAVLSLGTTAGQPMALVIVGDIAAPFAALDDGILRVVGEQVGSALERGELTRRLAVRTYDLERLSVRMLREHEDQRRRLGRELHDETAQVFSALKLQLGLLKEDAPAGVHERFDRLVEWVDRGSNSIRSATDGLRPAVLEDLGLLPALRALVGDVREWSGLGILFESRDWPSEPRRILSPEAEVAVFRALQEALSNVARHAQATAVHIRLALED
ncbi:MAG TPA: histidine kinase, partial [Gemmatimonadaceae bacterium]|nr:histidine kinase [Gemmatimonadaceae bacterium]